MYTCFGHQMKSTVNCVCNLSNVDKHTGRRSCEAEENETERASADTVHKRRAETKQISKGPDRSPSHSEQLADTGGPKREAYIPTRNLCH